MLWEYNLSSWRWACWCSKHVDYSSVTYILLLNKELCIKVGKWNNSILWCTVKKTSNLLTCIEVNLHGDINLHVAHVNFIKDLWVKWNIVNYGRANCLVPELLIAEAVHKSQSENNFICCMISYLNSLTLLWYQGNISPRDHHLICSTESKF
jgi:hypothetical protein